MVVMVRTRETIYDCWINYFLHEGKGREVALCKQKALPFGPSGDVLCSQLRVKNVCLRGF